MAIVTAVGEDPAPAAPARPNAAVLAAITAAGSLAMHIFVPALPAVAKDFDASPATIQLTLTLYLIGVAVGQLVYGPLSDRFGRRPVLIGAMGLFFASAVLAIFATGVGFLLAARVLQALGGCGGLVLGRAMVRDGATAEGAAAQLALLTMAMSVAPAAAPALGGLVNDLFGWRAIFALMAACGAALLAIALFVLPETSRTRVALPNPLALLRIYAELLRSRTFRNYAVGGACVTTSFYAFLAASPFLFIETMHRPAGEIGFYYMALIGGVTIGSFAANRLAGRLGMRTAVRAGAGLSILGAGSLLAVDLAGALSVPGVLAPMFLFMFAAGFTGPVAVAGSMSADPRRIGSASGLYGFLQMGVGALCTTLAGIWPAHSAAPIALILLGSALLAGVAFFRLPAAAAR